MLKQSISYCVTLLLCATLLFTSEASTWSVEQGQDAAKTVTTNFNTIALSGENGTSTLGEELGKYTILSIGRYNCYNTASFAKNARAVLDEMNLNYPVFLLDVDYDLNTILEQQANFDGITLSADTEKSSYSSVYSSLYRACTGNSSGSSVLPGAVVLDSSGSIVYCSVNNNTSKSLFQEVISQLTGIEVPVSVSSVSLSPSSLTLEEGESSTLEATIAPENATNQGVTWVSSDTSVATVNSSGKVTAKSVGTAKITVTTQSESKTSSINVTVTTSTLAPTGISLDRNTLELEAGDSSKLTAIVSPSSASDTALLWSSSNTTVATVSSSGTITAKSQGTATITVVTADGNYTASCVLSVSQGDSSTENNTTGDGNHYTISGTNVNYPSQAQIASYYNSKDISSSMAHTETYATEPSFSAPYESGYPSSTSLNHALNTFNYVRYVAGLSYNVGTTTDYNTLAQDATYLNYLNNELTHYPSTPSVLSGSAYSALVTSGKSGASSSNIGWASYHRNLSTSITDGWMNDGSSSNIQTLGHRRWILNPPLSNTGFGITSGSSGSYTAMYSFDNIYVNTNTTGVMWPAQNMPVDLFGSIYPWSYSVGETVSGTVTVTLTRLNDGKVWNFSNSDKNTSGKYFAVENTNYGQKGCIIFRPDPSDISYIHGDVFQVNISGAVTATYCVSFFDVNNVTDKATSLTPSSTPSSVTLSVSDRLITVTGVSVKADSTALKVGETTTVRATVSPSNASNQGVTWTSSDNEVATVNISGLVTAVSKGTTTIIATTADGNKSSSTTITVSDSTVDVTGITLNYSSLTISEGDSSTLLATVSPSNATNDTVLWTSSNPSVATVNLDGKVTAVASGSSIITATTEDGGKKANCTVTVPTKITITFPNTSTPSEDSSNNTTGGHIVDATFTKQFNDVKNSDWYYDSVQFVYQEGLMSGTDSSTFSPNNEATRGMIVTILYNYAGKPNISGTLGFGDVNASDYYAAPVLWANQNNIVAGISSDSFAPNNSVTREQLMVILYGYEKLSNGISGTNTISSSYTDRNTVSSWAYDAVAWGIDQGLISGRSGNTIAPTGTANRAEIAMILSNYANLTRETQTIDASAVNRAMEGYHQALLKQVGNDGTIVVFDNETVEYSDYYYVTVRYQISAAAADELLANGGFPQANTMVATATVDKITGQVDYDSWGGFDSWNLF